MLKEQLPERTQTQCVWTGGGALWGQPSGGYSKVAGDGQRAGAFATQEDFSQWGAGVNV